MDRQTSYYAWNTRFPELLSRLVLLDAETMEKDQKPSISTCKHIPLEVALLYVIILHCYAKSTVLHKCSKDSFYLCQHPTQFEELLFVILLNSW
jgi:hypothetical protein